MYAKQDNVQTNIESVLQCLSIK